MENSDKDQKNQNEWFSIKLAQPAIRALNSAGIYNMEQLTHYQENELLELHGIGLNAITQLRKALNSRGLSFRR